MNATPDARPKKETPLAAKVLIPLGLALFAITAAAFVTSILPTDVARLGAQYPAIEDRSARKAGGTGCAMCVGGGVTQAALKDYLQYAARMPAILGAGTSPVMAVQGSVDRNIDPMAIPKIGAALGARDHELHYVPGVTHDLVNVVTPAARPGVDAEVKRRLSVFLASVRRS